MKTKTKVTRIYHPWGMWECFKAGFFTTPKGKGQKETDRINYAKLLGDLEYFEKVLQKVLVEWPYSCEHNLTNDTMNRVAWLGQACGAYEFGCCADKIAGAFCDLSVVEQKSACDLAAKYLEQWLKQQEVKDERAKAI